MLCATGASVNIHSPVTRHLNGHMRGSAKSVECESGTLLDARQAQRAKADDSGAQQRRGLLIGKGFRNGIDEILRRDRVFRVAAIDGVAGERRDGRRDFPCPRGNIRRSDRCCAARRCPRVRPAETVSRPRRAFRPRPRPDDPESPAICAAAIRLRPRANRCGKRRTCSRAPALRPARVRVRNVGKLERIGLDGSRRAQKAGFHAQTLPVVWTAEHSQTVTVNGCMRECHGSR